MNSLLLVAHGSRRESSNDEIRSLTEDLRRKAGSRYAVVHCAFLELAEPSIPDGIRQCIRRGATRVTVFPYFLSAGRHVAADIPTEVNKVVADYPDTEITIAPYLGAAGTMGEVDPAARRIDFQMRGRSTRHIRTTGPINLNRCSDFEDDKTIIRN